MTQHGRDAREGGTGSPRVDLPRNQNAGDAFPHVERHGAHADLLRRDPKEIGRADIAAAFQP